ncbi:helix-hairpin-helix domain-containing protein [Intrasporangium calvum]|uniref:Helix-hairpin-helix motif protein n=1 Tax=Intrasporangium calvum (strain ATCC 23552 / DSM 43043 / JCM 3097 / NBRC 12989 / NCIMB 10167 / NRRL B-3866 / 7 KIP) TaxID=710696 RepID=E6SC24_INTC7|nr:helix-hairpin-helix domain-containing protein [Intrasporangium calvum]ADU49564.1 hypothetical protein Intca_3078 [Intrasporangium calvum DSM 43043]
MSFTTNPNPLLADKTWRRRNSAWLLWVILGFGMFSFVGFVLLATRMKTRRLWTIALAICGVTAVVFTVNVLTEDPTTQQLSDVGTAITMIAWFGMIATGVYLNREYLRWRAAGGIAKAWYNEPVQHADSTQAAPAPSPSTAPQAEVLGIKESDYFAAPAPVAAPTPATLDVNAASAAQLQASLGVDSRIADRIIEARRDNRGFRDLDDLANKAGLQPHEVVRVRDRITFGPFARSEAPSARPDEPRGRVLDF